MARIPSYFSGKIRQILSSCLGFKLWACRIPSPKGFPTSVGSMAPSHVAGLPKKQGTKN